MFWVHTYCTQRDFEDFTTVEALGLVTFAAGLSWVEQAEQAGSHRPSWMNIGAIGMIGTEQIFLIKFSINCLRNSS